MRKLAEKPFAGHPLIIPTQEEFFVWCENPVTQFVALAWKTAGELQKEDWIKKSWEGGNADPVELVKCKVREDAYLAFLQSGYEDYLAIVQTKNPLK